MIFLADLRATPGNLEGLILARGNALIDLDKTVCKPVCKSGSMIPHRLVEDRQTGISYELVLLLPPLIV